MEDGRGARGATRTLRRELALGGVLGGTALLGAFGVAGRTVRVLNGPRRRDPLDAFTFTPWELGVPYEPVAFRADDGVKLRGWWLPRPGSDRTIVGCTGHRGAKHELLGIGSGLWRAGNNVLLFDFRGCGESDPVALSVGYYEARDARAAVRFAREQLPDARVGLVGYSMGAAVAILVAAADQAIGAVVADSAFADLGAVVAHAYRRHRLPPAPFLALSDALNRRRWGWSFRALRPVDAVGALAPRPLLLIHGADDAVTPAAHAEELYRAAGEPKELWIVPGTRHCGAYFVDRSAYVARVAAFFARALGG